MNMKINDSSTYPAQRGFTLVELMVAMVIGLIATIGIVSLFSGTSRSNKLQEALARLQENGRYATLRMENDFRMGGAQYCTNSVGDKIPTATASPMWSDRPLRVYATNLNLPDSGGMQSVDQTTGGRSVAAAGASYLLSPRFFMQGFSCANGTSCSPALWNTGMFPAAGLSANRRVPNSDILTVRYLRGTGWPLADTGNCGPGGSFTLAPQPGDDLVSFVPASNQLALISDCLSPSVIPVTNIAGNTLTVGSQAASVTPPLCGPSTDADTRVYNFSRDFVTVTYYLAFRADDNPDARPNVGSNRLVPTLIRRENGVEQELVRGVDRLDFRYGVRDSAGNFRFLTAAQVDNGMSGAISCTSNDTSAAPAGPNPEPGCLWRSVQRIEAHLLVSSGDEVPSMDSIGMSYRYMDVDYPVTSSSNLPSGIRAMSVPRREFVAYAALRNRTP
jgi:type IV pilus assembly protein PilW